MAESLSAQASPFLTIDHPATGLVEWLIARGDLRDPTPMVRPFRRIDVMHAIDSMRVDPASQAGRVAAHLKRLLADRDSENWYRIEPNGGVQAFSSARRDLLHPAGEGGVRSYFEGRFEGRFGALVLASKAVADNRLKLDPDWLGGPIQQTKNQAYRFTDAYLSAQFKSVRLSYGQLDRNWGPVGSLGLAIANFGYSRTDLSLEIVLQRLQIQIAGTELTEMRSSGGPIHKRYFMAHRMNLGVTKRLNLAIWETAVLAGENQSFDPGFRNPLILLSFPVQQGLRDDRNTIIGGDLSWRAPNGVLFEGQAMIDDRWRKKPDPKTGEPNHPGRYALTGAASGPLGSRLSWRTSLSLVSSLAYRTTDSAKSFLDRGIGIGPNFTDLARFDAEVAVPVRSRWLVAPTFTWLKQGEGRLGANFPSDSAYANTPEFFIGTPSRTIGLGARVTGRSRGVSLSGAGGWFHTSNADHRPGVTRSRFGARLTTTIGTSWSGIIK